MTRISGPDSAKSTSEDPLITALQAAHLLVRKRLGQPFATHEFMWQASLRDCENTLAACQHYRTLSRADPDGAQAQKAKRILPLFDCKAVEQR